MYVDGGVRSGLDVLAALALGADAAFLGRPPLYALAAAGQDGVTRLLHELAGELLEALRLAGCRDLREARDLLPAVPRIRLLGNGRRADPSPCDRPHQ